jgi:Carboxypeptidase regulatory-like domain
MPCTGKFAFHRRGCSKLIGAILHLFLYGLLYPACAQQPFATDTINAELPNTPGESLRSQNSLGSITGIVVDHDGAYVPNARITLTREDSASSDRSTLSRADGSFSFTKTLPGTFRLTIVADGFTTQQISVTLHAGESYTASRISLRSAASINVQVTATQEEVAQAQIQDEEKQRVLGIVPNFFVSYEANPASLTSKQKFELTLKTLIDPVTFAFTGVIAGIQQSQNDFSGFGSGPQGYAKRYAASYGTNLTANLLGNAILPSILKQDPRYIYKGTGTIRSRILYTMAMAVICKGDTGHWQFNYSGILGSVAADGISNFYYPAADRDGAALTFENLGLSIGGSAISNLFQEFLIPKLTPHKPPLPQS